MAYIPKTGISNTSTIQAEHITRIIDALDGTAATEVSASGQFNGSHTGSFLGDGSGLTGVTGEWDGTHNGNAQITGSLVVTANVTASGNISASGDIIGKDIQAYGDVEIYSNSGGDPTIKFGTNDDKIYLTGNIINISPDDTDILSISDQDTNVNVDGNLRVTSHITGSGNITADNGNISASGDLYSGDRLYIRSKDALDVNIAGTLLGINASGLFTDGVAINRGNLPQPVTLYGNVTASGKLTADGNISGSGNLNVQGTINATNHNIGFFDGSNTNLGYENNTPIRLGKSGNPTTVVGHLTASGNISSSGHIIASAFAGGTPGAGTSQIDMSVAGRIDFNPNNSVAVRLSDSLVTLNNNTFISGNATASGNISSSFSSASSGADGVPSVSGFEIAAHRYITRTQSVTAAGDTKDNATLISPDAGIVFVAGANNTAGVRLPLSSLMELGTTITVMNGVALATLEVYPNEGEVLLPMLSANGPATVPAGATIVCTRFGNGRWICYFGGVIS